MDRGQIEVGLPQRMVGSLDDITERKHQQEEMLRLENRLQQAERFSLHTCKVFCFAGYQQQPRTWLAWGSLPRYRRLGSLRRLGCSQSGHSMRVRRVGQCGACPPPAEVHKAAVDQEPTRDRLLSQL
jgi:hypothetical protein